MSGYQGPTLRQMEYVLAVARTGKFGEAARECGVSQPALSKQIQEAEAIAGGPLFERARPRALLTARGEIFVKRARRALDEANMLFEAVHGCDRELGGELHLGVIPTIAPYLLPGLLGELREAYPSLIVVLHEAYTDEILAALGDGDLDLVLLAMPIEEQRLVGEDLYNEPFALLAPTGHRLAGDDRVCASELRDASLLLMEEGHCFRDQALEVCALAGAHERAQIRAASVSTLVRMVEAGVGATLVPVLSLRAEAQGVPGLNVRFFREDEVVTRRIGLRWRDSDPRDDAFRALAGIIREHARDLSERSIESRQQDAVGLSILGE